MSEKTGDDLRHDLMFYWLLLRIEVKFPEILATQSGGSWSSSGPDQRSAEIDEADVGDLLGEGDVEDGEAGARVRHHVEHLVRGDVLDVEGVEAAALGQGGQGEAGPGARGQEVDPRPGPGGQRVRVCVEMEDQSSKSVSAKHGEAEHVSRLRGLGNLKH